MNIIFNVLVFLKNPYYTEQLARELGDKLPGSYDLVVGPAMGGVILAYELARYYGVETIFSEREQGKMTFRRGFQVEPGPEVLIVEDVVTTGGSVKEVIELVRALGGQVKDVAAIVDRSGGNVDFTSYDTNFTSLINIDIKTYEQQECPLCKQGSKPIKPGSRDDIS